VRAIDSNYPPFPVRRSVYRNTCLAASRLPLSAHPDLSPRHDGSPLRLKGYHFFADTKLTFFTSFSLSKSEAGFSLPVPLIRRSVSYTKVCIVFISEKQSFSSIRHGKISLVANWSWVFLFFTFFSDISSPTPQDSRKS